MTTDYIKLFMAQWGFMILVYEFWVLKKVRPITHGNEEIHKKYPAFRREDKEHFTNRFRMYLCIWMYIPRLIMTAFSMIMLTTGAGVLNIGSSIDDHTNSGIRFFLTKVWFRIWARLLLFSMSGIIWIGHKRPQVSYKKYLGEDWVADYDGKCSTMIGNHQAF